MVIRMVFALLDVMSGLEKMGRHGDEDPVVL
jgi:hypothetical protein